MAKRRQTIDFSQELLDFRPEADSWDGPHFRLFSCGFSNFTKTPPYHAMFMDAMEPLGCWEYVVSGSVYYELGSERHRVDAGEVLITRRPDPGWMVRPVRGEPVRTVWLTVTGTQALGMFDFLHFKFGQIYRLPDKSATLRSAKRLIRLVHDQPHRSAHFWSTRTFDWMNTWWKEAQDNHCEHDLPHHLDAVKPSRLISYAPRTVKNFAKEMGYSRSYLTRKLTKQWTRSPGKVLREVRLQDAANLLRTTRLTVNDVAEKVGYASTAAFCRAFARQYDQTPTAYRRSHR